MGDFYLDFRDSEQRFSGAQKNLRFYPDLDVDRICNDRFNLVLTRNGRSDLWAPYIAPNGTVVALAGRIALDSADWEASKLLPGEGGLAAKAIYKALEEKGYAGVQRLHGAFAIHIYEPAIHRYSLIIDPAGCYATYAAKDSAVPVFSSQVDQVAEAISANDTWDYVSLAGFLKTGQIPHPYTYYQSVVGVDWGTSYVFDLSQSTGVVVSKRKFAQSQFDVRDDSNEDDLAEELAAAVSRCAKQATQPILGDTFIALSGGLDARLLISHADIHQNLRAFSSRGAVNDEYRTAAAVAKAVGAEIIPMIRSFDHYADNAEMGVRISGGMGNIFTNHFLGFREQLRDLGCDNLVTGDQFDNLFKSAILDSKESRVLRREVLTDFDHLCHFPHFAIETKYEETVLNRMTENLDEEVLTSNSDAAHLTIAAHRAFPLFRAGTNIHPTVANSVFGLYMPGAFSEILDIYWRTPLAARLNKSLIKNVYMRSVSPNVLKIPDHNTGLPINASPIMVTIYRYRIALRRLIERHSQQLDTDDSWLNWGYYLRKSEKIKELWCRQDIKARALIEELTGRPFSPDIESYLSVSFHYFLRLLTIKLWAEQRNRNFH